MQTCNCTLSNCTGLVYIQCGCANAFSGELTVCMLSCSLNTYIGECVASTDAKAFPWYYYGYRALVHHWRHLNLFKPQFSKFITCGGRKKFATHSGNNSKILMVFNCGPIKGTFLSNIASTSSLFDVLLFLLYCWFASTAYMFLQHFHPSSLWSILYCGSGL